MVCMSKQLIHWVPSVRITGNNVLTENCADIVMEREGGGNGVIAVDSFSLTLLHSEQSFCCSECSRVKTQGVCVVNSTNICQSVLT